MPNKTKVCAHAHSFSYEDKDIPRKIIILKNHFLKNMFTERHNSHSIQFIHKCTWVFSIFRVVTIKTNNCRTFQYLMPTAPQPLSPPALGKHSPTLSIVVPTLDILDEWNHSLCGLWDWILGFSIVFSRSSYPFQMKI